MGRDRKEDIIDITGKEEQSEQRSAFPGLCFYCFRSDTLLASVLRHIFLYKSCEGGFLLDVGLKDKW